MAMNECATFVRQSPDSFSHASDGCRCETVSSHVEAFQILCMRSFVAPCSCQLGAWKRDDRPDASCLEINLRS